MQWAQRIDDYVQRVFTRHWTESMRRRYLENLSFTRDETSEHRAAVRALDQMDTKASGTLAHISMMIAAMGITAVSQIIDHDSERFVVYLTIGAYLVLSLMCLRCMNGFSRDIETGPRDVFLSHLVNELIYRKELYTRANNATTGLTGIVLVLIYAFYFY